jgi:hypothetical protein
VLEVDELVDLDVQGVIGDTVSHCRASHGEVDSVAIVRTDSLEIWMQFMGVQALT